MGDVVPEDTDFACGGVRAGAGVEVEGFVGGVRAAVAVGVGLDGW